MSLPTASTLTKKTANKQNPHPRIRSKHTTHNLLEQQAMQRLNELSEVDVNRLVSASGNGFTSWNDFHDDKQDEVREKKHSARALKVKYRGFSFWKRADSKTGVDKQKRQGTTEGRRRSVNTSAGKLNRNHTEQNNQKVEKMTSSEIFVRKFSRKDRSNAELAKRYLLNNVFKQEAPNLKVRSFQAHSKTMLVSKRRPRTGSSSSNLTRLSNDMSRNQSFEQPQGSKVKLDRLIADSQKLIRKAKKRCFNPKLQRDNQRSSNPFLKILKQKYKSYMYAPEVQ